MTALLEMAPRTAGDTAIDFDIEFEAGVGIGTDPVNCTHCCGDDFSESWYASSSYMYDPADDEA